MLLGIAVLSGSSLSWGQQIGARRCGHGFAGFSPPKLNSAQAAADHLRRKPNFRIPRIHRYFASLFTTPFKSLGLFGWTGYCTQACGVGEVLHADRSLDGFYTVDLVLDSFSVAGQPTRLDKPRYIRAEVRGRARHIARRELRRGETGRLCGELRWDRDGFLEIHPREESQVEALAPRPKSPPIAGTPQPVAGSH